ncbi:MAG: TetR/AcrR family transcriptional regulator [Pseudomonas sp.]|uniref:TetR/AcrR family transcriptional regulator n=1 Tax=Pseudomonas sp. TaxID=306 RepID=UPI0033943391
MSSSETLEPGPSHPPRRRLSREERQRQLLDVAWKLVREDGTEGLTLGRLAEQAGVTKPVVYDHFGTRPGLLAALYKKFDARQHTLMDAALQTSESTLPSKATVIASSYIHCVLQQGKEIPGVIAALASSPELEEIKREHQALFMDKCRATLSPFTDGCVIAPAGLWAMLGAAEALSHAAVTGGITANQAQDELVETIVAMVQRSAQGSPGAAGDH